MSDSPLELVWSKNAAGQGGPFAALLEAAENDAEAAEGLVLAYASMGTEDRARLVTSIVEDGEAAGRSPAGPLALLLGVEEDQDLAARIAAGLDETLERSGLDDGYLWGDDDAGGAALIRHLHGGFVEAVRVSWDGTEIDVQTEPLARHDDGQLVRRQGVPDSARRVPLSHAVDDLAAALWRARRRGAGYPDSLRAFAHVFSTAQHLAAPPIDGPPPDGVD